jgi:molybdopterin-guanine dinucleotide biosynthesis protein A
MGGADKGLLDYGGRPLAQQVAERLAPQVETLLINANRNREAYTALGYPVIGDAIPDFAGPLAGLHAALAAASTPLVVMAPCDSPFFPVDLVLRLRVALLESGAELAVAMAEGRVHAAFCLCSRDLADPLAEYLAAGGRRVIDWQESRRQVRVAFADPDAFRNLNTPEALR